MKIIKVDTDNKTEVLDFPEGTIMEELEALRTMVGPECRLVEHVRPMKLYTVFGAPSSPNPVSYTHLTLPTTPYV